MSARSRIVRDAFSTASKFISSYSRRTVDIDYKILRHAGWKPGAARGISHGIFAGSIGNYLKESDTLTEDGSLSKNEHGNQTSSQDKTRGRQFRNNKYSRNSGRRCTCAKYRRSSSR